MSVVIIGAGPVGLALAAELGWREIDCHVIEKRDDQVNHPKMNTVASRSMEFCRRWGIAEDVKNAGFPRDFPRRTTFVTGLDGYFLFDYDYGPLAQRQAEAINTPEVTITCPQNFFDPVLQRHAAGFASVHFHYQIRLDTFAERDGGVDVQATNLLSGQSETFTATYLVGCDGASSSVRELAGIEMEGPKKFETNFNVIFDAPDLIASHDKGRATMYWLMGADGLWGTLRAVDGSRTYRLMVNDQAVVTEYLADPKGFDAEAVVRRAIGNDIAFTITWITPWKRQSLTAAQFRKGRVFLAGDAAHLLSPTGAFGMNTGIQDAVDLGWKLAAVEQGWAAESLLKSYEIERKPVAARNVGEAAENARKLASIPTGAEISAKGVEGERLRERVRSYIRQNAFNREFETEGINLGYRYDDSPIVIPDGTPAPLDDVTVYNQTARPGARAPHCWLEDGRSTLDLFGRDFTLVSFDASVQTDSLLAPARALGVPLETVVVTETKAALLYGAKLVLVRPDGHVAWRGNELPSDVRALLDTIRGVGVPDRRP